MTLPTVNQVRRQVRLSDNSFRFEITTSITDAGDLPYRQLFVASIVDPLNEKSDVLARLATPLDLRADGSDVFVRVDSADLRTIAGDPFLRVASSSDLTSLPRDRSAAVARGLTTYLTSTATVLYTTQVTAQAAYKTLLDRLSQLVVDWRSYNATFLTAPSQNYTLPLVGASVESEYTALYVTAKAATTAARTVRETAQAAVEACGLQDALLDSILNILLTDVSFLELAKSKISALAETGTVLLAKAFALNGADPASYEALLVAKRAQLAQQQAAVRAHRTTCAGLARALQTAETVLQTAEAAERTALTDLLRVCPTFDPNSL